MRDITPIDGFAYELYHLLDIGFEGPLVVAERLDIYTESDLDREKEEGYASGYNDGYDDGRNDGYEDGYQDALDAD